MSERRMTFGDHEVRIEPHSGLIHIVFVGLLNDIELSQLSEFVTNWQGESVSGQPMFVLVDNRKCTGITKEGRKAMAQLGSRDKFPVYCSMFGSSLVVRVIVNLIFKAVAISSNSSTALSYEATEAEAREWLDEHRRAYLA